MALLIAIAVGALALGARSTAAQEEVTIAVGDIWFCDASSQGAECGTDIYVGDTVTWDFSGAQIAHTTTACGETCDTPTDTPLWDSGVVADGGTFSYTFDEAGLYPYFCRIHPTLQFGRIDVHEGARPATPTPVLISPPVDYIGTPEPTPDVLPDVGGGPQAGDGWGWLAGVALATSAALALAAAGIQRAKRSGER